MLTRYGFVQVLDTGSWLENTLALRRRIESGEVPGPAIRTTGPGFAPRDASPFYILPDHLPELRSAADAKTQIALRLREGADAIKLFTGSFASPTNIVPMPLDIVRAATTEAHRRGWEPSLVGRVLRAHLALIPTLKLWTFELSRKNADSAAVQRFLNVAIEQLRGFLRAGGEVLFGTDVGYMTDYDPTDEYVYMQRAGASFRQILTTLTTAPAKRFGQSGHATGRLSIRAPADIVVLYGDPAVDIRALARVRYLLRQGRAIYQADTAVSH